MGALLDAVKEKDKGAMLRATLESIATTIEGTESGRDIAALTKRLQETWESLEEYEAKNAPVKTSAFDKARAKHGN